MSKSNHRMLFTLLYPICLILLSFASSGAEELKRVNVQSFPIEEKIGFFSHGGKSYVTIGNSEASVLIGYQSYKDITLPDGQVRTILMRRGIGENDEWMGSYRGGVYRLGSKKAILVSNVENRNVFLNGKERTYLMKKDVYSDRWKVALADGKIYCENSKRELVHCGHEELRKVMLNGKTLYLRMKKSSDPNSAWTCEYNKTLLCSD